MIHALTELLSRLRLSAATPFGSLSGVASLVAVCVAGLLGAVLLRGGRGRAFAVGLAVLAAGRLGLGIASGVLVTEDLNPTVRPDELVGSWRDGAQELTLRADHTFQLRGPAAEAGTWALRDQEISLGVTRGRVIEVNGERRIVLRFPHAQDLWDGHLGFVHDAAR